MVAAVNKNIRARFPVFPNVYATVVSARLPRGSFRSNSSSYCLLDPWRKVF